MKNLYAKFQYDHSTGIMSFDKKEKIYKRKLDGYVIYTIKNKTVSEHRLAWFLFYNKEPDGFIDHINHIRDDNRIINLRCVTRQGNNKNASKRKDNTSGQTGVTFCKNSNKWRARIKVDGVYISLGYYKSKECAVTKRKDAEKKYNFHPNHGQ